MHLRLTEVVPGTSARVSCLCQTSFFPPSSPSDYLVIHVSSLDLAAKLWSHDNIGVNICFLYANTSNNLIRLNSSDVPLYRSLRHHGACVCVCVRHNQAAVGRQTCSPPAGL